MDETIISESIEQRRRSMAAYGQDGALAISKEGVYHSENNNVIQVLAQEDEKLSHIEQFKRDLLRFEIYPTEEIEDIFAENEDINVRFQKVLRQIELQERNRIRTLVNYYTLGSLINTYGTKYLKEMSLTTNFVKKLRLKSSRTFKLFRTVGKHQIYNTRYISVRKIIELSQRQFNEVLKEIEVSQELNI